MIYEIVPSLETFVIKRLNEDGTDSFIPMDEANSDYLQYLIDTDGGLKAPKSKAK